MISFGGMVAFELKDGYNAYVYLMDKIGLIILAVSLGTVNILICHPAGMIYVGILAEDRHRMSIFEGLIRLWVDIENIKDIFLILNSVCLDIL